jgi:hypothetical protein
MSLSGETINESKIVVIKPYEKRNYVEIRG